MLPSLPDKMVALFTAVMLWTLPLKHYHWNITIGTHYHWNITIGTLPLEHCPHNPTTHLHLYQSTWWSSPCPAFFQTLEQCSQQSLQRPLACLFLYSRLTRTATQVSSQDYVWSLAKCPPWSCDFAPTSLERSYPPWTMGANQHTRQKSRGYRGGAEGPCSMVT